MHARSSSPPTALQRWHRRVQAALQALVQRWAGDVRPAPALVPIPVRAAPPRGRPPRVGGR